MFDHARGFMTQEFLDLLGVVVWWQVFVLIRISIFNQRCKWHTPGFVLYLITFTAKMMYLFGEAVVYGQAFRCRPLQWRHNGRDSVSNHQPRDCLLNRLFRRRSNNTSKLRVTGLCAVNSPVPGEFPHRWPVTRKMFPFDDAIMHTDHGNHLSHSGLSVNASWLWQFVSILLLIQGLGPANERRCYFVTVTTSLID